jgi:integrase
MRKGWPPIIKTFRIRRDAEDWARSTEDEIIRGIYVPRNDSEKLTISNALDRYRKDVSPTKQASTQNREKSRIKQLKSSLGNYSLASLNAETIAKFRDKRIADGKSNNTVRLELALLSHLYTTAIREWGLGVVVNPVANVRKPSPGKARDRRLDAEEEVRLLAACDEHSNPFLGWMVRLALYTAMRHGEIASLTASQVNLSKQTIFLSDTKNNDVRTVPLTDKAFATIKEVLDFPIRPDDTDLLFYGNPGRDGKRRPYQSGRVWDEALVRAGITNLRFHDLRHEATSRFVEAGLSDQQVSAITGHKSMQMLKRYTHLRNEDLVSLIKGV